MTFLARFLGAAIALALLASAGACRAAPGQPAESRIRVVLDTDANKELDVWEDFNGAAIMRDFIRAWRPSSSHADGPGASRGTHATAAQRGWKVVPLLWFLDKAAEAANF